MWEFMDYFKVVFSEKILKKYELEAEIDKSKKAKKECKDVVLKL